MDATQSPQPADSPALSDALAAYLRAGRIRRLSPYTLTGYATVVGSLVGFAAMTGVSSLDGLGVDLAEAWLESRPQLAAASVRSYVRTLRAFGHWCAGRYHRPDPLARLIAPRVPRRIRSLLSDEQLRSLVAAAAPNVAYAIILLLETGLRASEAIGVDLADIDDEGIVVRHPTGGRERWVPLSPPLRQATRRYLGRVRPALARPGVTTLLVGQRGDAMRRESLRQALARAAGRAQTEGVRVSPHLFRHQFTHDYSMSGGALFALRDTLGHASLEMLATYANPSPADLAEGIAAHSPLAARARGPHLSGLAPRAAHRGIRQPAARRSGRAANAGHGPR
jgi:site-specific recombinase XerD